MKNEELILERNADGANPTREIVARSRGTGKCSGVWNFKKPHKNSIKNVKLKMKNEYKYREAKTEEEAVLKKSNLNDHFFL